MELYACRKQHDSEASIPVSLCLCSDGRTGLCGRGAARAHLEAELQEGEGGPHVDVLVLVEPPLGQARVEAQQREGGEDVLVQRIVVAVHMM
jgi:hypothetical protein